MKHLREIISEDRYNKLNSWQKMLDIIKKNATKKDQSKFVNQFVRELYNKNNNPVHSDYGKDASLKEKSIYDIRKSFPHHFNDDTEKELSKNCNDYYDHHINNTIIKHITKPTTGV